MKSLLHLIYPATCVHCKELLLSFQKVLCPTCVEQLTLIDINQRCTKCFKESHSQVCEACRLNLPTYSKLALCFDSIGPSLSLINEFPNRLFLDEQLSPWMVVQMERMHFPKPNIIIPFPQNFNDKFLDGYSRSKLLAANIGKYYELPISDCLECNQNDQYSWRRSIPVSDQRILLVLEKIHSMETIAQCAKFMNTGFPQGIYIIALTAFHDAF